MNSRRRSFLSMLDNAVRWTGFPARVAAEMSDSPSADRKHRPLRWVPIWAIAFSCALFILSVTWPPTLDLVSSGAVIAMLAGLMGTIGALVPGIHTSGPLGKSSLEDDEREAALRKDSFLFCFWLLALVNCLGQPLLMILSHFQHWQTFQSAIVAGSTLTLNATLFGCLPTLYASWNLRKLPKE
jgi:hypothetical protein